MEDAFSSLATTAERRGWTANEAAFALLNLALSRILTIEANLETDEAIARSLRSIHGI